LCTIFKKIINYVVFNDTISIINYVVSVFFKKNYVVSAVVKLNEIQ